MKHIRLAFFRNLDGKLEFPKKEIIQMLKLLLVPK